MSEDPARAGGSGGSGGRATADPLAAEFRDLPDDVRREFGPAPFWWWDGGRLSEERITDQLETLSERGVTGVCFEQKYPHGPPEGPQVEYFSDEWWRYMEHAVEECDRLGMRIWIHDETYHHSPPVWKRYWQSRVEEEAREDPELRGYVLDCVRERVIGPASVSLDLPPSFESVTAGAYPIREDGTVDLDGRRAIAVDGESASTTVPEGEWLVAAVGRRPQGLRRTSRAVVDRILERHYGEYERRLGDHFGDAIAGTFQDELFILHGSVPIDGGHPDERREGVPYDERLRSRFESEYGYDPEPLLVGLYEDVGPVTERLRCQFYDAVTATLEENWFQPLYEWHEERGLALAHDNWGRNDLCRQTTEYGNYYRTMRWFQVPGYDDGGPFDRVGERNFFDGKLAASIATCYDRDRVWGELFHTTGWGFPPERQLAGVVENYCYGCSLYNMHGLYYGTLGGWYEHAPPDTHFRQPYWEHADDLYDAVARLSRLFGRGSPVFDAAVLYPGASMHACWRPGEGISERGEAVDEATRDLAESLYRGGLDHLIVDAESLADAETDGSTLRVAGVELPALVLGPSVAVSREVAEVAARFYEAGGIVISVGPLPVASAEGGRGDDALDATLERAFGPDFRETSPEEPLVRENDAGGASIRLGAAAFCDDAGAPAPIGDSIDDLLAAVDRYVDRDVRLRGDRRAGGAREADPAAADRDLVHAHRRVGDRDCYLLLNAADESRTLDVGLRSTGRPERWDPLTGTVEAVDGRDRGDGYTDVELSLAPHEFRLVTFRPGDETAEVDVGTADIRRPTAAETGERVAVEGPWEFEPKPALDNEHGDFRHPPSDSLLGPEVRRFRYRIEGGGADGIEAEWYDFDAEGSADAGRVIGGNADDAPGTRVGPDGAPHAVDGTRIDMTPEFGAESADAVGIAADADGWSVLQWGYGQHFWLAEGEGRPAATPDEDPEGWVPYAFSTAAGKPGTHPDDHGLNGVVSEDFLRSPAGDGANYFWTAVRAGEGGAFACHYGPGVERLLIDGEEVDGLSAGGGTVEVSLPAGAPGVLLAVEPGTDTHLAFEPPGGDVPESAPAHVPRLRWFRGEGCLRFDARPDERTVGWYRFSLPAGARAFTVPVRGAARAWVDGEEVSVGDGRVELDGAADPTPVAVRVEHDPGAYGGEAWTAPIEVETGPVAVDLADWRDLGLSAYSGLGVYRTTVEAPDVDEGDAVVLDLGEVAVSAAVRVNGTPVGTSLSRPHRFDATGALRAGENEIEVEVANTVANHFEREAPTRYVYEGQTASGLLGPVELRVLSAAPDERGR